MKRILQVLKELIDNGPATSEDIADELGISKNAASAHLSNLYLA